jgi:hypothetical protein
MVMKTWLPLRTLNLRLVSLPAKLQRRLVRRMNAPLSFLSQFSQSVRDLLNFGRDLTVDVFQCDCVNAGQLYLIESYRESLVIHQVEIPDV